MESFKITLNDCEIEVIPQLHENFYAIKWNGQSAMIGKGADGMWDLALQTSGATELPADQIGREIDLFNGGKDLI